MKLYIKLLLLLSVTSAAAQCPYDNTLYLTGAAPTIVGSSIVGTQTWGGDFNRVTGMQAGYTYEITTCNSPTFDSEITIYPAGGGTAVAHDDDGCGITGGASKIMFTPTVSGDYDILLDEYQCVSNQIDMDMVLTLVSTGGGGTPASLTIPVVVHVVSKNSAEDISDNQILSQINALTRDYRKLNADFSQTPAAFQPLGADMDISFCLASIDPNGNPTTGITRTSTTIQSFDHSAEPKFTSTGGHDNWDPTKYLNLWVCDLTGGLLGYATFPADLATAPQLDGVVVDYAYFGTINATAPFDLGRTATHEVGHWLNLRHIWGDANCGDDFVNDTPVQQSANTGCPAFPHPSCSNGANGDLFYDYMDYSDDACLLLFTAGQKQRAQATIATVRTALATSNGCGLATGVNSAAENISIDIYPNPAHEKVTVEITGKSGTSTKLKLYNIMGAEVHSIEMTNYADGKNTFEVRNLSKGVYMVELSGASSRLIKKLIVQ